MKVGIAGTGLVGSACALAVVLRGSARELVLLNRTRQRAAAIAADIRYGTPLAPPIDVRDGDYTDLDGAAVVMITAGINEKAGGATNRSDPAGRLRLLERNAEVYEQIIPQIVKAAPEAVLLVVTDPPDPLADLARRLAAHDRVLSTGTFLDSLRFRVHVARKLNLSAASVEAMVVGEHGTSQVFLWSSARVDGKPIADVVAQRGETLETFGKEVENEVRYANITIIEGNDASQFGIGVVSARITEAILRDENIILPVGSYQEKYGATLSLPSVVGQGGIRRILEPAMSDLERRALERSAEQIRTAFQQRPKAA